LRFTLKTCFCLLSLLLIAGGPAAATDLTIISKVTNDKGTDTSTTYITETRFRMVGAEADIIFEIDTGRMIQVDHKKKKYFVTSLEELNAQMAQLTKMFDENPMLGKMMGDLTADAQVRKLTDTRTIAGYECVHYVLDLGKNISVDLWVAPDLKPPVSYHDARKLLYAQMGPMAKQFEKMIDEFKKMEGFSLASTTETKFMGREMVVKEEAQEVKKGPIPAATFEPPAGYKQGKSPFRQ
jgi:hypothetical protein